MPGLLRKLCAIAVVLLLATGAGSAQDKITLRFAQPWPASHPQWVHGGRVFVDYVTKATNGEVEFELYHSAQLGDDSLGLLTSGLTDLALMSSGYAADRLPLSNVAELPGIFVSACDANRKFRKIATKGGALFENEYKAFRLHPIYMAMSPPASLVMGHGKVARLDDVKGLKLRASGGGATEIAHSLGGVPVQTVASELYDALKRGTIDGAIYYYVGMPSFSLEDVFKSGVDNLRFGSTSVFTAMTEDRWAQMPPNVQKAMTEGATLAEQSLCKWFDENEAGIRNKMVSERGFQAISLPQDDIERWNALKTEIADSWAKRMDDNGRKGTEVLEDFRAAE